MSMNCMCGERGWCIESRRIPAARETRRRYVCSSTKCGKRWTTYEIVSPPMKKNTSSSLLRKAVSAKLAKETVREIGDKVDAVLRQLGRKK